MLSVERILMLWLNKIILLPRASVKSVIIAISKQEFVRPRWPYDMWPSARGEKYMCVIVIR